jgi:16S rRNA (uracil1498-N3)-methyltransferase
MADRPRRLFAPALLEAGGETLLPAESARHAHVLRLRTGERVRLFDGRSGEADAVVRVISRERVVCHAEPRVQLPPPATSLHVVLGLPKGGVLEDITRMLTELGASSLHVALCARSVPRPTESSARMQRLERIALEACAQSGQARALAIYAPRPLLEIAGSAPAGARKLVFWERAETPLGEIWPVGVAATEVWAIVGPEGGLGEDEVAAACALGFRSVGLGASLLRVGTAAPVIAGLLLERLGRLQ